jgi:polyisoprenyl-phosphate glycosyltransferase
MRYPNCDPMQVMAAASGGDVPEVSLIVPVFNEATSIAPFLDRVLPVLAGMSVSWEVLFVDDGSSDATGATILAQRASESRIRLLQLSRNFGKEAALTAGLDHAIGAAAIPIDVDLQDPPELIPELVEQWRAGFQVVHAVRCARPGDSNAKRITARLFYRLFNRLSSLRIEENAGDFRLLDRAVVDAVRCLRERNRFMKGLVAWPGFKQTSVVFDRPARTTGRTSWNWWRLWNFALTGIAAFSTVPLRIWSYVGGAVALGAFAHATFLVIRTLAAGIDVPGYASVMATMLVLGGVQLLSIGITASYVGRIFEEVKQRPIYVVAAAHGLESR